MTLLAMTMVGLLVAAILAVYTYSTSPAETPVVVATVVLGVGAALVGLGAAVGRRRRGSEE